MAPCAHTYERTSALAIAALCAHTTTTAPPLSPPPPPPLRHDYPQSLDKALEGSVDVCRALRSVRFDDDVLNQVSLRVEQQPLGIRRKAALHAHARRASNLLFLPTDQPAG